MNGEERRLLTGFIGDFREFRGEMNARLKNVDEALRDVKEQLEEGNKAFSDIRLNCVDREHEISNHEKRLMEVEKKDALGGTKLWEKGLIIGQPLALLLKSAFDYFTGG